MRKTLLLGGLALVLVAVNGLIVAKELVLARGTPVLLELAPRDPRSLMQGDYMTLAYSLSRELETLPDLPGDGRVVVRLDARGVATLVRVHDGASPMGAGEHLLRYRRRSGFVRVASDAFFFQEGHAERYERARFGELRVAESGDAVLMGLRDDELRQLR